MVFITGDCHGDFTRFSTRNFEDQKNMTHDDTVIVCGDFGIWDGNNEEKYWIKWLNKKPFTTVFVDGNHENFDRLNGGEFKVIDFHGGLAHKISSNIYHLMRGYVFEFDGKNFWCFGGARSHDISDGIIDPLSYSSNKEFVETVKMWRYMQKDFRINHISWWEDELPNEEELARGLSILEENNYSVDYVITHCCPGFIESMMGFNGSDKLTRYFNKVADSLQFKSWHFGHYHVESSYIGKYIAHYKHINRIL